jgi:hypothetical protein
VREPLLRIRKTDSSGDIASVNRHCCRVTGRIAISGVERCDKSGCEGKIRTLESNVRTLYVIC